MKTVTLYRPVGPLERQLIEESGWLKFPPRLPEQPIFYPVMNKEYAIQIARDWNVRDSGAGYVTPFRGRGRRRVSIEVPRPKSRWQPAHGALGTGGRT